MQGQWGWWLCFACSLLGRSDPAGKHGQACAGPRASDNLPTLCCHGWEQLLKEGAVLTHSSVLPILASSRKGTPHAASPPEVNVTTTPSTPLSWALAFPQALSHAGLEMGSGSSSLGSGILLLNGLPGCLCPTSPPHFSL